MALRTRSNIVEAYASCATDWHAGWSPTAIGQPVLAAVLVGAAADTLATCRIQDTQWGSGCRLSTCFTTKVTPTSTAWQDVFEEIDLQLLWNTSCLNEGTNAEFFDVRNSYGAMHEVDPRSIISLYQQRSDRLAENLRASPARAAQARTGGACNQLEGHMLGSAQA